MPRYYFHVKRGQVTVLDHDGLELADSQGAEEEAKRRAREIAAAQTLKGMAPKGISIVVADERWSPVFEVPFDDAGTT